MEKQEILDLIESMLDSAANDDGRAADEARIWNRALITLGRKIDPEFHAYYSKPKECDLCGRELKPGQDVLCDSCAANENAEPEPQEEDQKE